MKFFGTDISRVADSASAYANQYVNVEVDLGSAPVLTGSFLITPGSTTLTAGKPVQIFQAVGPYTGKGTLEDEVEMDQLDVTGVVANTTTIRCYFMASNFVAGKFKFNYTIGI